MPAMPPPKDNDPRQVSGSGERKGTRGELGAALEGALSRSIEGVEQVTLLFSGGLDSSLLAHMLLRRASSAPEPQGGGPELRAVTVGLAGSADLQQAESAARLLGIPWTPFELRPEEIAKAADRVRAVESSDGPGKGTVSPSPPLQGMPLGVQTALYLALAKSPDARVLCGQGADELFLGYAHFRPLQGERLHVRYREDLRRLQEEEWPCTQRLAASLAKDLRAPYLDPAWVREVELFPLEARRSATEPKALLRVLARELGLPQELAERKKKAMQYGSGVHATLGRR